MTNFAYNFSSYFLSLFLLIVCVYFSSHGIYGGKGFLRYFEIQNELIQSENQLRTLQFERVQLDQSAKLLRSSGLDKDMLSEQVKRILGGGISTNEKVFTVK